MISAENDMLDSKHLNFPAVSSAKLENDTLPLQKKKLPVDGGLQTDRAVIGTDIITAEETQVGWHPINVYNRRIPVYP